MYKDTWDIKRTRIVGVRLSGEDKNNHGWEKKHKTL